MTRLFQSAAIVAAITFLTNLGGFVREVLFARTFGAGAEADAYIISFTIVSTCFLVFSAGSLQGAFMPAFQNALGKKKYAEARGIWLLTLRLLLFILLPTVVLLMVGAEVWIRLIAPGFSSQLVLLTSSLLRWQSPVVLFFVVGNLMQSVLHSRHHFFLPAFVPFLLNAFSILALLTVVPVMGIHGMALTVLIGSTLWLSLWPYAKRLIPNVSPFLPPRFASELAIAMAPLMILLMIDQISALIQKAILSNLEVGSIAVLSYAYRIVGLPIGIFASAIAIVLFPALVDSLVNNNHKQTQERFKAAVQAVFLCSVPATVFLMTRSHLAIRVLFERGAFDSSTTLRVSNALIWYAIGILPQSLIVLINRLYYADKNTKTPMQAGLIAASFHIFSCWAIAGIAGYIGIAIATSLYALIYLGLLLLNLPKDLKITINDWFSCGWRPLIAGVVMALGYLGLQTSENFIGLTLAIVEGAVIYFATLGLLKDPIMSRKFFAKHEEGKL